MSDYLFSNCNTRCDNPKCKFINGHSYPCSSSLDYEISRCSNSPCCKTNGHNGECLYHKNNDIITYNQPTMFNTQYQSHINDNKSYSNFNNNNNNNNDQRKFTINYITVNNYYGTSGPSGNSNTSSLNDTIDKSKFMLGFR